jgi:hypothetical protein
LISEISHTQGELATIEITNYFTTSDAIAYMTLTQGLAVSILVREGFVEREIFDIADALHATQGNTVDQFILNQIDSRAFPLLSEEEGEFPDDFEP